MQSVSIDYLVLVPQDACSNSDVHPNGTRHALASTRAQTDCLAGLSVDIDEAAAKTEYPWLHKSWWVKFDTATMPQLSVIFSTIMIVCNVSPRMPSPCSKVTPPPINTFTTRCFVVFSVGGDF